MLQYDLNRSSHCVFAGIEVEEGKYREEEKEGKEEGVDDDDDDNEDNVVCSSLHMLNPSWHEIKQYNILID